MFPVKRGNQQTFLENLLSARKCVKSFIFLTHERHRNSCTALSSFHFVDVKTKIWNVQVIYPKSHGEKMVEMGLKHSSLTSGPNKFAYFNNKEKRDTWKLNILVGETLLYSRPRKLIFLKLSGPFNRYFSSSAYISNYPNLALPREVFSYDHLLIYRA